MTPLDTWLWIGGLFVAICYIWLVVLPLLSQTRSDRRAWRDAKRRRELNRVSVPALWKDTDDAQR